MHYCQLDYLDTSYPMLSYSTGSDYIFNFTAAVYYSKIFHFVPTKSKNMFLILTNKVKEEKLD